MPSTAQELDADFNRGAVRARGLTLAFALLVGCTPSPQATGAKSATRPKLDHAAVREAESAGQRDQAGPTEPRESAEEEEAWTAVDVGGARIVELPIAEADAERLVWASSMEGPPEQYSASVLTLDGEVVYVHLSGAPEQLPPLRSGTVVVHADSTDMTPAHLTRLNRLIRSRPIFFQYIVWDDEPSVAPLAGVEGLQDLFVETYLEEPLDITPLRNVETLEDLTVDGRLSVETLFALRDLPRLRRLNFGEPISRCDLTRLAEAMPRVEFSNLEVEEETPCPRR